MTEEKKPSSPKPPPKPAKSVVKKVQGSKDKPRPGRGS